jgi:flavodoxin I
MSKTAIIYSFNSQKSKKISEKVVDAFGESDIDRINAEEVNRSIIEKYDQFIFSVPTWFDGELPNYWDEFIPDFEEIKLKGKKFALFGLGDQKNYPENFCDALGIMAEIIESQGGELVGKISPEGYEFESSKALRDDNFIGLPLDQENQARLTNERIKKWVDQIKKEF